MDAFFLLGVVAVTSTAACLLARRRWGPPGDVVGRLLEWAGLSVVFVVLNLVAGVLAVWILRAVTGRFVSMYVNTDTTIVLFSMAQAVVVQWWGTSRRPD
jgi:hypothetical protein